VVVVIPVAVMTVRKAAPGPFEQGAADVR